MRVEQRRTVAHSIFRSGPLSDRICGRWDSTVELEVGTIVQVATLTGPVSPAASLCSLSLPLSSLFILLSSFFFIFLSPHLSRTHELTTRVCASPPSPPYVRCLGSYDGPEVMRRGMGSMPRGTSTMGMVMVKHSLDMRCGQG
jgi:hypothetical protein